MSFRDNSVALFVKQLPVWTLDLNYHNFKSQG